jgi:hypothetical protein
MTAAVGDRGRVLDLLWGFFPAQVIQTLTALGVPDALGERPRNLAELAAEVGAQEQPLYRLLRAATGLGLVETDAEGTWRLTADGELLRTGAPGAIGNVARLFCGGNRWQAWGELEHSVRTGEPSFVKVAGKTPFAYMAEDPELLAVFTAAMAEGSRTSAPGIVATCDLAGVGTLVDVGGGNGTLLAAFLAANPGLHGILFDTAEGVGDARDVLPERAEIVTGDFFEHVPGGDAHVIKSVIHDWDDEHSIAILGRIREAMPPHGKLFLVEPVLPDDHEGLARSKVTLMSDLNMLIMLGGRERTEGEFRALLTAAGLRLVDVTPAPPGSFSVLTAVPE